VADAEAGFGGALNVFELVKASSRRARPAYTWKISLSSEKKCGHMGGKVLIPTQTAVRNLVAARLGDGRDGCADGACGAHRCCGATLMMSDADPYDRASPSASALQDGFLRAKAGVQAAIARGLAYAAVADIIWCETAEPDIDEAREFAEGVHAQFPGKLFAYNCSPSFNWKKKLTRHHRQLPARAGGDGLQVPVRDACRLPCSQLLDVRTGAGLQAPRHGCLC
jgi:isocitrate lyase